MSSSLCGKKFNNKESRNQCEMKCKGEFKYECATCDKKFLLKQRLVHHERLHTGERPFGCPHPG